MISELLVSYSFKPMEEFHALEAGPKIRRWRWKPVVSLVIFHILSGCSFVPIANTKRRSQVQLWFTAGSDSSNLDATVDKHTSSPGGNQARKLLAFLQAQYPNSDTDKASWDKTKMYLYRAKERLTMEQIERVVNWLDEEFPPTTTTKILQTSPRILRKPVDSFLQPTADFLQTLWGPKLFQKAIERNPQLLLSSGVGYTQREEESDKEIERILRTTAGLSPKAIRELKQTAPFLFGLSIEKVRSVTEYLFELLQSSDGLPSSTAEAERLEEKNRKSIGRIIATHPNLLNLSVDTNIRPRVDFLQSKYGMNTTQVAKMIHASTGTIMSLSVEDNLKPTLDYLEQVMMETTESSTAETIHKYLVSHPQILTLSMSNLQSKVEYFARLDTDDTSSNSTESLASRILRRCPAVYSLSLNDNIIPKVELLSKVWGVSADKSSACFKEASLYYRLFEYPNVLTMSLEGNLRPTLNFFNRTGYTLLDDDWRLISGSTRIPGRYMAASLYNRLLPRWHYCLNQGFRVDDEDDASKSTPPPPLHLLVQATDTTFCQKLGLEYDDFLDFKEATIPRLKFSSQFDTWLKTGRPIQV